MGDLHFHSIPAFYRQNIPAKFTFPFSYVPSEICIYAANQVQMYLAQKEEWSEELKGGKMFGVLVVKDKHGEWGYLAAFSGQIAGCFCHDFFVPPVFDYLDPEGCFKKKEKEISAINKRCESLVSSERYISVKRELMQLRENGEKEKNMYKKKMTECKAVRDRKRQEAQLSDVEKDEMIRESQFQKAEYRRLKQKINEDLKEKENELRCLDEEIEKLKKERVERSVALQHWLFSHFVFLNGKGESANLLDIFKDSVRKEPPSGAGECCAPKLLQYAYLHGMLPVSMAEFWWGKSPRQEVRRHGYYYAACKSKCEPILRFMLQGLNVEESPLLRRATAETNVKIEYEDEYLIVANKPSGMLSVQGRIEAGTIVDYMVEQRTELADLNEGKGLLAVHRLDMDTSGLIVLAKTREIHKKMQALFENRKIEKQYKARLNGHVKTPELEIETTLFGERKKVGVIDLPLMPDLSDRPRQLVDKENGKTAVTYYSIERSDGNGTYVDFYPQTGRTHQLRVHAAHVEGVGCAIEGDDLYGKPAGRLCLHAFRIRFLHPVTGEIVDVKSAYNMF